MKRLLKAGCVTAMLALSAPAWAATRYGEPQPLLPPSQPFKGLHGLAIDAKGRLLAGSVIGPAIRQIDIASGKATVLIAGAEGAADDIAIGPKGELVWTAPFEGVLRYRASDSAPIRQLASGLPGMNSAAFDQKSGRLYASQDFEGDALWEMDPTGVKPPRLIAEKLGNLNGFEVGADGWIYGPIVNKGQIVRIDPDSAPGKLDIRVIADGLIAPTAANFDSKGMLWVTSGATGELLKIDPKTGTKTRAAQLRPGLDNLAIDRQDHVFVSNMAEHSVEEFDPATGKLRTITRGAFAIPGAIKLSEDGRTLYVVDFFNLRSIDLASGKLSDLKRMMASDLHPATGIGLSKQHLLLTSWYSHSVQVMDRASLQSVGGAHPFAGSRDVLELPDGSLLVIEAEQGRLLRLSGDGWSQRDTLVQGLEDPVQFIRTRDGAIYVTESSGRISRVDVGDGSRKTVTEGLKGPEGIAEMPDGKLLVAETGAQRLIEVDPATGKRRVLKDHLPIGAFLGGPGVKPGDVPTGVAVDARGNLYFSSDRDNTIYRISTQ